MILVPIQQSNNKIIFAEQYKTNFQKQLRLGVQRLLHTYVQNMDSQNACAAASQNKPEACRHCRFSP